MSESDVAVFLVFLIFVLVCILVIRLVCAEDWNSQEGYVVDEDGDSEEDQPQNQYPIPSAPLHYPVQPQYLIPTAPVFQPMQSEQYLQTPYPPPPPYDEVPQYQQEPLFGWNSARNMT